ncbi:hypothetical protein GGS21DRAFT_206458 [Xylaria nigripes]|nr:hypothetical protein GGS21DRAFT_206458 [Xylaria nigripes]
MIADTACSCPVSHGLILFVFVCDVSLSQMLPIESWYREGEMHMDFSLLHLELEQGLLSGTYRIVFPMLSLPCMRESKGLIRLDITERVLYCQRNPFPFSTPHQTAVMTKKPPASAHQRRGPLHR